MNQMFYRKLCLLTGIMIFLSALGAGVVAFANKRGEEASKAQITIVTSFYPMYIAALNLTEGIEDVQVINLTENSSGCLHDYQLTTKDMRLISEADIMILNGGGMEHFIDDVSLKYPELIKIVAAEGIDFLTGGGHIHEEAAGDGYFPGEEAVNGHVWMEPRLYLEEVSTIAKGLVEADSSHAEQYRLNFERYQEKINTLTDEIEALAEQLKERNIVIFHEAFAYLAKAFQMEVIHTIDLDEEETTSAAELAEVIDEVKLFKASMLWVDQGTDTKPAEQVERETEAILITLDALVSGSVSKDAYIEGMKRNIETLNEAYKKELQ